MAGLNVECKDFTFHEILPIVLESSELQKIINTELWIVMIVSFAIFIR